MYTVRTVPPSRLTDARGLTLDAVFVRLMALADRQYAFVRTGWAMQLLMTSIAPGEPDFISHATNNAVARLEIKKQVCRHGLGLFQVLTDLEYEQALAQVVQAAE